MRRKSTKNLWIGTVTGTATFLITGYLFNLVNDKAIDSGEWMYLFMYTIVLSFSLSFILWKMKRVGRSLLLTGIILGIIAAFLFLAAIRVLSFQSDEPIICCQGMTCWVIGVQTMMATAMMALASDGKTSSGADD